MNILGFNPSHHGSVCLLQDGEIKYFIQEERIGNREKYAGYPFRSFIDILEKYQIDSIITATPGLKYPSNQRELENKDSNYWEILACSYNPKIKAYDGSQTLHHKAVSRCGSRPCLVSRRIKSGATCCLACPTDRSTSSSGRTDC